MVRILSIDGGGIRGIIPARILISLEDKLKKHSNNPDARLADYFDFIAGTSTGGILACIYLFPDNNNRPKFSANDALNFYKSYGEKIFRQTLWRKITTVWGLLRGKYAPDVLEECLDKYFGESTLDQLLKPCIIPSFSIRPNVSDGLEKNRPYFFTQHDAKLKPKENFSLKEVCRSTSAAPTYFPPAFALSNFGEGMGTIDGGVFANNPTLCAYAEVRKAVSQPKAKDMFIVSLSTGTTGVRIDYSKAKNWGTIHWVKPLIDTMMSGVSQTTSYQLKKIFEAAEVPDQYIRLEPRLESGEASMDNASPENIQNLIRIGEQKAKSKNEELEYIAKRLVETKPQKLEYVLR
ncbi:CBASS cGAMP-activated phospholipase [Cytophagaceae bacterium ABcell3]|nr:CBASS cGAMP-activated phospholipase [Cytophagaceae bacterium ABcell3]